MKTLREYIDQLDEISRRDFLKGAGAAAVGAAVGKPQDAEADWRYGSQEDRLTGEKSQIMTNSSEENPNIILNARPWQTLGGNYVVLLTGLNKTDIRGTHKVGEIRGDIYPYRIVVNKTLYRKDGLLVPSDNSSFLILAIQSRINNDIVNALIDGREKGLPIKIELGSNIFTFRH